MTGETHQQAAELVIDQNSNRGIGSSSILFSCSAIAAILFCLFLVVYNYSLKRNISSLEDQKASIISQIQTPENLKLEQTINSTAAAIGQLSSLYDPDYFANSSFLTEFNKLVNKTASVTTLSLDENDNLRIDGQTNGMTSLAVFLQSLENTGYLSKVNLVGVSNESLDNVSSTKFSISCFLDRDKARASLVKTTENSSSGATNSSSNTSVDTANTTQDNIDTPYEEPNL
jgi:hypothetical protein